MLKPASFSGGIPRFFPPPLKTCSGAATKVPLSLLKLKSALLYSKRNPNTLARLNSWFRSSISWSKERKVCWNCKTTTLKWFLDKICYIIEVVLHWVLKTFLDYLGFKTLTPKCMISNQSADGSAVYGVTRRQFVKITNRIE